MGAIATTGTGVVLNSDHDVDQDVDQDACKDGIEDRFEFVHAAGMGFFLESSYMHS
jgi:hypothetical protein